MKIRVRDSYDPLIVVTSGLYEPAVGQQQVLLMIRNHSLVKVDALAIYVWGNSNQHPLVFHQFIVHVGNVHHAASVFQFIIKFKT